jgi:nitroreductase
MHNKVDDELLKISLGEALAKRRSIRGFTSETVPDDVMSSIFRQAQLAPSNCNTQPWSIYVVSGSAKQKLAKALVATVSSGQKAESDFRYYDKFTGHYRDRQLNCASALYDNMGIERRNREGRQYAMLRNFEFFGAPHVAFICMPKEFDVVNAVDVGIYFQTLMLVMQAHGVSCCAQGALAFYPGPIRELLKIDDSLGIVVGLSFGYEDQQQPVNNTVTTRAPMSEVVTFLR